jgi:hypothetical protein
MMMFDTCSRSHLVKKARVVVDLVSFRHDMISNEAKV